MSNSGDNQYVRRVVLPSGRAIEVVYFEQFGDELHDEGSHAPPSDGPVDLTICPDCERDLVYPVNWEEASDTHWRVWLRCPNCEWHEDDLFDQPTVDRFDKKLDKGLDALERDLKRRVKANGKPDLELLKRALREDALLPEDF